MATEAQILTKDTIYERIRTNLSAFYAKQTQFQVGVNQHKLLYDKYICKNGHLVIRKKQSQLKPKQTQLKPKQTQLKPKQTQFKANLSKG